MSALGCQYHCLADQTFKQGYVQVEKEALSLVFGVTKFHQDLYGRRFSLLTDHKPLTSQAWDRTSCSSSDATLGTPTLGVQLRHLLPPDNSPQQCLPLPSLSCSDESTFFNMAQLDALPVHHSAVKSFTITDSTLSRVLNYTCAGWPAKVPGALTLYHNCRSELLSVEEVCLLWGTRVLILTDLQPKVLEELHKGHPGIVWMKALARSHVWWPSID